MASTDTKLRLAHTLRAMMATTALDHITISALTKQAGVTRNTFYYHFEDIYSLLAWVYEQEIIVQMAKYAQITEWQKALRMLLDYIEENREFCVASFHSVGRDLLEQLLATVADALVRGVVNDADASLPKPLTDDICNFYGLAIVAQIIQWLMHGLAEPKTAIVHRCDIMLTGAVQNAIHNAAI
ncbi:TetR/AcrR family transcriptional regulator [Lacticaseibacillus nasuensis]|uniref:TetR/AcrR family transcriptional regulator n=1 Tax=Lacticaseibacillus nasuensis TaxID=944671 RepID=UPI002246F98A|nr:TetR/AcrR family transcriptional regulator C-terminal domain-containing protein [Lacticaseibacillus nasuensis]MCX2454995.1 TetR/AcrR family transcriptional regulator C-terminal domain-containing protein [Lacticaseibacillus nasuensis]